MKRMKGGGIEGASPPLPFTLEDLGEPMFQPLPPPHPRSPDIYRYPGPLERKGRDGASEWGMRAWEHSWGLL